MITTPSYDSKSMADSVAKALTREFNLSCKVIEDEVNYDNEIEVTSTDPEMCKLSKRLPTEIKNCFCVEIRETVSEEKNEAISTFLAGYVYGWHGNMENMNELQ